MNEEDVRFEDELRGALHGAYADRRPRPALEREIVGALGTQRRTRLHPILALRFPAVAAVLLVAVVAVPLLVRFGGGAGSGATGPSSAVSLPVVPGSPPPAPGSNAPVVAGDGHFSAHGIAFDYPTVWRVSRTTTEGLLHTTALAFLGTGIGMQTCDTNLRQPMPPALDDMAGGCQTSVQLAPGQVVVEVTFFERRLLAGPIDPNDRTVLAGDQRYVTVGGLPAIYSEANSREFGADAMRSWTLSVPSSVTQRFTIAAWMKAPNLEASEAQLAALVASVRYVPDVEALDPSKADLMAGVAIGGVTTDDSALWCLPPTTGKAAGAELTVGPGGAPLRKPLPVTCTTQVVAEPVHLWRVTGTIDWGAAADRPAGRWTVVVWMDAVGHRISTSYSGDQWPYLVTPAVSPPPPPIPGPTKPAGAP